MAFLEPSTRFLLNNKPFRQNRRKDMNRINHHGMKSTERFNRARRMLFSWLLVGMLLLGSAIPATASTELSGSERTSGNKNPIAESFRARGANTEETARPETHNGNN